MAEQNGGDGAGKTRKSEPTEYVVLRAKREGGGDFEFVRNPDHPEGYWEASDAVGAEEKAHGDADGAIEYRACPARSWASSANVLEAEEVVQTRVKRRKPKAQGAGQAALAGGKAEAAVPSEA